MGILRRGILGPVENTTGAVIGKVSNGQNIITGLRDVIPPLATEDQAEQRYKFKLLRDFFSSMPELVTVGFKKKKKVQSPANAAYSHNFKKAFNTLETVEGAEKLNLKVRIKLDYSALVYSIGPISGPNCGTAVRNSDGTCTFSWLSYPQSKNNLLIDQAGYLIYNASTGEASYQIGIAARSDLTFNVALSPDDDVAELHFYMHFYSSTTLAIGNSIYLGSTR